MKRLSLIALALATTAISFAQNTDYTPTNLAFRLGFAYPLNDTTRDLSKRFIGVGADYYFPTQFIRGSQTYLSIDWLGKSGNGAKGNVFPIMLNQKFYGRNQEEGRANSYGFFGIGIAVVDVTSTKTVVGGRVGFGVDLGPNIFVEAAFTITDNANGAKGDNVGLWLGYHF